MIYAGVVTDREWINILNRMPKLRKLETLREQETTEEEVNGISRTLTDKMFGNRWTIVIPDRRVYEDELEVQSKGGFLWD